MTGAPGPPGRGQVPPPPRPDAPLGPSWLRTPLPEPGWTPADIAPAFLAPLGGALLVATFIDQFTRVRGPGAYFALSLLQEAATREWSSTGSGSSGRRRSW